MASQLRGLLDALDGLTKPISISGTPVASSDETDKASSAIYVQIRELIKTDSFTSTARAELPAPSGPLVEILTKAAIRDLAPTSVGPRTRKECLHTLGYLTHLPSMVPCFTREQTIDIFVAIERVIRTQETKAHVQLAFWCISVQNLPGNVLPLTLVEAV